MCSSSGPHTRMRSETPVDQAARAWQRPVCPPSGEASAGAVARAWLELRGVVVVVGGVVVVVGLVRRRRRRGSRDAPHQLKVESTPSACGAAAQELGGGAEPCAYGLADGLGLGEGLVPCARPARIRLSPHRAARPKGSPVWRNLDVGAAPHLWPRVWGAVSTRIEQRVVMEKVL